MRSTPRISRPLKRTPPGGFTLIELMIAVSIIVVLIAVTVPTLSIMRRQSAESVAVSTVQIAGATARGYANRPDRAFLTDLVQGTAAAEQGVYSGYAVIFTPNGEARIVENYEGARDTNGAPGRALERINRLLDYHHQGTTGHTDIVPDHLNGFRDGPIGPQPLEYIRFPADAGYCGIVRPSTGGSNLAPRMVPPPFAVWYDENGQLVAGEAPEKCVYYDGNYNDEYDINDGRPGTYNPERYDPSSPEFDTAAAVHTSSDRFVVPFERIETVVGVWTYSKDAYRAAIDAGDVHPWTVMDQNAMNMRQRWLQENGKLVMFSWQAGTPMRSSDE